LESFVHPVVKTERHAQTSNSSQKIKEGKLLRSSKALAIGGVKILPVFSFFASAIFLQIPAPSPKVIREFTDFTRTVNWHKAFIKLFSEEF
jgi:hypothetical protein